MTVTEAGVLAPLAQRQVQTFACVSAWPPSHHVGPQAPAQASVASISDSHVGPLKDGQRLAQTFAPAAKGGGRHPPPATTRQALTKHEFSRDLREPSLDNRTPASFFITPVETSVADSGLMRAWTA